MHSRSTPSPVIPVSTSKRRQGWRWGFTPQLRGAAARHPGPPPPRHRGRSLEQRKRGKISRFWGSACGWRPRIPARHRRGPVISRRGLFAGKGRQRGRVTPHFLPFLEAARSERDARALITGCFHNTGPGLLLLGALWHPLPASVSPFCLLGCPLVLSCPTGGCVGLCKAQDGTGAARGLRGVPVPSPGGSWLGPGLSSCCCKHWWQGSGAAPPGQDLEPWLLPGRRLAAPGAAQSQAGDSGVWPCARAGC